MSMLTIPVTIPDEDAYVLFVILAQGNIDRIKAYDPAEIHFDAMPIEFNRLDLKAVHIMYASDDEIKEIMDNPNDVPKLIKKLARGWQYRPDLGDNDEPYKSLGPFFK